MKDRTEVVVPPVVIDAVIAAEKAEPRRTHHESKTSAGLRGRFMGNSVSFFVSRDTITDREERPDDDRAHSSWCCWN